MKTGLLCALAAAALISGPAAQAGLTGETVGVGYFFPDAATPYPFATATPPVFVVGAGAESVVNVEGVTALAIDFSDAALTIDYTTTLLDPTWTNTAFNGLIFDSTGFAAITGVTVNAATNLAGFDISRVSIVGDELRINWAGLSYSSDTVVALDFTLVPEPATWAMMIAGFGLVGAGLRRRRAAVAIAYGAIPPIVR